MTKKAHKGRMVRKQVQRDALSKVIASHMKATGLDDQDFATALNKIGVQCTYQDVERWRRGDTTPHSIALIGIAKVASIDMAKIQLN